MTGFDPRCPWESRCRCTHTVCVKGWLPDAEGTTVAGNHSEHVARRCPVCESARKNVPYIPPTDRAALAAGERPWAEELT